MAIKYHHNLIQHTDEWRQARCGLLTASEMDLVITPAKLQIANNEKARIHLAELAAQRVNQYVEPTYQGYDMERGIIEEIEARNLYSATYSPVKECGFITNDGFSYTDAAGIEHQFTLGMSPDGLVNAGDGFEDTDGQIEIKSRNQKHQFATITAHEMPAEFLIQVQTGLLITERPWCDFISYSNGMPMMTKRVFADRKAQEAILTAAKVFHQQLDALVKIYESRLADPDVRLIPTERKVYKTNGDISGDEE